MPLSIDDSNRKDIYQPIANGLEKPLMDGRKAEIRVRARQNTAGREGQVCDRVANFCKREAHSDNLTLLSSPFLQRRA